MPVSAGIFNETNEGVEGVAHSTPPTMNSATMSANAVVTNAASARYARADSRDFRERIGFLQARKSGHG